MTTAVSAGEPMKLQIPGLELAARVWGPADGLPVLALHGWLDNSASFEPLAPLLPGHRLVAIELPGHGHSDHRPTGVAYHFVDYIADIFEAADALGWQRFAIIGHSMGAGVAALAAGTFPDRVARLALIEGIGPVVSLAEEVPSRVADHIRQRQGLRHRDPRPLPSVEAAAALLVKVVPNLSLSAATRLATRGTVAVEGGVRWRSDPRLKRTSPLRFNESQVRAFLRRIVCPTVVIWAVQGWPLPQDVLDARQQSIAGVDVFRLPGGHHLHMDEAESVAEVLRPFLANG